MPLNELQKQAENAGLHLTLYQNRRARIQTLILAHLFALIVFEWFPKKR